MKSCITDDYREMMASLIANEVGNTVLSAVIGSFNSCEKVLSAEGAIAALKQSMAPVASVKKEDAARRMAGRWPSARYFDEKGAVTDYASPSELYTKLTGKPVSGQVCNEEGTACRALSLVDNFRITGFTVMGDGEAPPPSPPDAPRGQVERSHQAWKQHLLDVGKKVMVFHPESPALKEMQAKREK